MASVGIRELSEHTSEIIRRVRNNQESIEITYRGQTVATIEPALTDHSHPSFDERWAQRMRLADEIGQQWPPGLSAAQAIAEDRE